LLSAGILTDRFRELSQPVKVRQNYFQVENGIPGFGYTDFRLLVEGSGEIARECSILTIAVVTKPFLFEGKNGIFRLKMVLLS